MPGPRGKFSRVRSEGTGMVEERVRRAGRVVYGSENPVPVVGGVLNTITIQTGRRLVDSANVAVKLDAPCIAVPDGHALYIEALESNLGDLFVGNKESRQYPLAPGDGVRVKVMHSHGVWFEGANVGDGVKYIVESDRVIH